MHHRCNMLLCYGSGATNFALVKAIYKSVSLEQIVDTHTNRVERTNRK